MGKKRVILVHGFNVRDGGAKTTGSLRPYFERRGFEVVELKTGWRGIFMAWLGNAKFARRVASKVQRGDILLGHSDGCNIIDQACWLIGGHIRKVQVVYLNPALDSNAALAPVVKQCLVYHTHTDRVVWISKFIPFNRWGADGQDRIPAQG